MGYLSETQFIKIFVRFPQCESLFLKMIDHFQGVLVAENSRFKGQCEDRVLTAICITGT